MTEYIDIVDEFNKVIGAEERDSVHDRKLMHRAVHIFLFNHKGELFLQKRADSKKEHPKKYDSSASGHVDSGEDYDECAKRELKEELDIEDVPLKKIMQIDACDATDNEFVCFYTTVTDDEPKINTEEISEGHFWPTDEIKKKIDSEKSAFTPAFLLLFENYLKLVRIINLLT